MKVLRGKKDWGKLKTKFDGFSKRSDKDREIDARFFVPGKDDDGNIAATIRFLPSPTAEAVVEESRHFFAGVVDPISGKQESYIEPCGRAVKKKCPACEMAGKAWEAGDKNAYKKWGNNSKFVANILVIKDINKPSNNGKVFLWRFGKIINTKIDDKMIPKSKLVESVIVFDYDEGCNFNLIGSDNVFIAGGKEIKYSDFKASAFVEGKLTDEQIQDADDALHDMSEWNEDVYYKDYDVCKTRLNTVMGINPAVPEVAPVVPVVATTESDSDLEAIEALSDPTSITPEDEDESDIMERIKKLTNA